MYRSSSLIPKVKHLWLVLMNVLVLQSFLAVSSLFQLQFNILTACVTPIELFADLNMVEAVTAIPWDLKEAYYCLTVC